MQLDELHLRMLCENLLQNVRRIVEGEANVLHLALCLEPLHKRKAAVLDGARIVDVAQTVEQVEVEILYAAAGKLLRKNPLVVLRLIDQPDGHFIRQEKGTPGMPLYQGFSGSLLAFFLVIGIGGVEISEALGQILVHHFFKLGHIDRRRVVLLQQGQTHQTEAQLLIVS